MSKSVKITAAVITFNEERKVAWCLDSLRGVADEIVVVDSFSTDRTVEICKTKGVRVVKHAFEGHIEQKNYAMSLASHDHILSLDADEVLSEELKNSILNVKNNWTRDGYWLNRLTNYCGSWIRHCGWYPDKKLRLWDKRRGCWGGINPHDKVVMTQSASTTHLSGDLLHYSYSSIKQHISHANNFSDIAAMAAYRADRRSEVIRDIFLNPTFTFLKKYFLQLGVLDGYYGFVISIISAFGKFLKYAKLRELAVTRNREGKRP